MNTRKIGRKIGLALALGLVLLAGSRPVRADQAGPFEWDKVGRIVAIGDVHGSYDKFVSLIRGTGLVNEGLAWTGGAAHLVLAGDLVDRGPDDRKVMDLVMRLQSEAKAAGGAVHALLGNHDIMVLMGDLRYVDKKSFAAFAPDEKPEDREKAWAGYITAYPAARAGDPKLRAAFDDSYPPGYFGFVRMFDLDGPYGAWALTRPAVVKINGIVFVHGGLTEKSAAKGLEGMNREIHASLVAFDKAAKTLEPLVKGPAGLEETAKVADDIRDGDLKGASPAQVEAAATVAESGDSPLLAADSPVWYRGNSVESETLERRRIDAVLGLLKADTLVVGHTPTARGLVTSRFGARVYRADVGQAYGRQPYCLVFEGSGVRVFDPQKSAYGDAEPETPQGQQWTTMMPQLTDRQLEDYLRKAPIEKSTDLRVDDRVAQLLELNRDGLKFRALFLAFEEKPTANAANSTVRLRRYQHEVAAYWLDRRLKLRLVPVTVARTIDGRPGAIQIWVEPPVDRVWVEQQNLLDKVREELSSEIDKAWVLEALLDVAGRVKEGQRVLLDEGRILLTGSTLAFSTSGEIRPEALPHLKCPVNPSLENELTTLTRAELKKALKDDLSDAQIDALLARRDKILALCAGGPR